MGSVQTQFILWEKDGNDWNQNSQLVNIAPI